MSKTVLAALAATLLTYLAGCADPAATVRQFTYPPDFKYVTKAELDTAMGALLEHLQILEGTLAPLEEPPPPVDQARVVEELAAIERIARGLEAGPAGSNHPFLQDQMGRFVARVQQARLAAAMDPPRYYQAGTVAGACAQCHVLAR